MCLFPSGTPERDGILNNTLVLHHPSQGRGTGKMLSSGYTNGVTKRTNLQLVKQIPCVHVLASWWRETIPHWMFLEVPITLSRQLVSLCLQARKAISWLIGPSQDKEVYTL